MSKHLYIFIVPQNSKMSRRFNILAEIFPDFMWERVPFKIKGFVPDNVCFGAVLHENRLVAKRAPLPVFFREFCNEPGLVLICCAELRRFGQDHR